MTHAGPFRPIETWYHGCRFRSRLEARWAVAFDQIGLRWDYEREGFHLGDGTLYLPDFWLPQTQFWAEVKPNDTTERVVVSPEALRKCCLLAIGSQHSVLLLDGPPRDTNYWAVCPDPTEPSGCDWVDVHLFDENRYHETEGRFYMDCGATAFDHYPDGFLTHCGRSDTLHPAVQAARSAQFEHGAQP